ncbi:MAG: hypothetical protein M3Y81_13620, partial [Chloroflexota bacterium]|nr:hypothetical protein [Chloroflexota bacterium]
RRETVVSISGEMAAPLRRCVTIWYGNFNVSFNLRRDGSSFAPAGVSCLFGSGARGGFARQTSFAVPIAHV